jgi:hypothetical protein
VCFFGAPPKIALSAAVIAELMAHDVDNAGPDVSQFLLLMPEQGVVDEEDLEELPPLDGDLNDEAESDPSDEDLVKDSEEDASLDDSTAENDPPDSSDLDLDSAEGGWLNEAADAQDLDLGDSAIVDFSDDGGTESPRRAETMDGTSPATGRGQNLDDDLGVGDEDFGFGNAPERGGLDGGDEGPLDDEELREADLPALDADEEGELEDEALVDPGFGADDALGLPWADRPWSRVGSPVALTGATAVACIARGALITAQFEGGEAQLVRLDLEGACDRLPAEGLDPKSVRVLAVEGDRVLAVTEGGKLFMSSDAGRRFDCLTMAEPIGVSDALFLSGRLWMRTCSGGLLSADPVPAQKGPPAIQPEHALIERYPIPGIAAALTLDAACAPKDVVVLVVDDRGQPAALVHPAAGASARREPIEAPESRLPTLFAARCGHIAYVGRHEGIVRRTSGGNWESFAWDGRVTAIAFVDDAGTLVASTYSDVDDTTALVRLDSAGKALVVARVGAVQADPGFGGLVCAMAHDEARGVVWIAGAFGVSAFATN